MASSHWSATVSRHVSIQANTIKTKSSPQTLDLRFSLHFRRFLHKTPQISSEQSPIDAAAVTASLVPACTDLPGEPATPFRSQPTAHQKSLVCSAIQTETLVDQEAVAQRQQCQQYCDRITRKINRSSHPDAMRLFEGKPRRLP